MEEEELRMKKLNIQEFDEVYALFEKAFIPAELRPYEKMLPLLEKGEFDVYGYYQNNKLTGALLIWEFDDFVYLENFAVDESVRGQGIGSILLDEMKTLFPHKLLILEVEEPTDDISKRRIGFYERNVYFLNPFHYIQPTLRSNATEVNLMLMSYPESINVYSFDQIKKQIFRVVYQQMV